jgi:hypothetical protein
MSKPSFWSKPTMPNNHDKPIGAPQLQQPKKLETLNRFPAENDLSGTATLTDTNASLRPAYWRVE